MRYSLALLASLVLAAQAFAAVPRAADWRLLEPPQNGDSASVIDVSTVQDRRDGKFAHVAVIYDEQSEMAALEMTLVIDCAGLRERALSFKLHDRAGKVFPQGVSKKFEKTDGQRPWHKYLCASGVANKALPSLGAEFPLAAVSKLVNDSAARTIEQPARIK